MTAEGLRLRPAADDTDAAFIVEQMVASALEFAPPDQPFGIAETVRRPETALRWMESCRGKVQRSRAADAAAHTRLWIAEDSAGARLGSVGIQRDVSPDADIVEIVSQRLGMTDTAASSLPAMAELVSYYVAKEGRGRGVGALLMDTALSFARGAGYVALSLYVFRVLTAAIHVYHRHGFFIALQFYAPGHWDEDNVMVKLLVETEGPGRQQRIGAKAPL
eukprot:COSAG04_NODE_572_length_12537_cov_5.475559_3_plen_220_part_00